MTSQRTAEAHIIRRIARRALDRISGLRMQGVLSVDLQRDLAACHACCPLRLDALLAADELTFATEIQNLRGRLNRATGRLPLGYVPRFHQRTGQRPAPTAPRWPAMDPTAAERKRQQRARDQGKLQGQVATAALAQGA